MTNPTNAAQPLAGIRVLEVAHLVPGAVVGWWLAALGAEVVKVEDPRRGDYTRAIPPYADGEGLMHLVSNQGKRSVALDLAAPDGQATFRALCAEADVVIDGFRPESLARYGVDYAELRRRHPRLVVCSVSGFGQDGPLAGQGAHGTTIDTLAGVAPIRDTPDGGVALAWELSSTLGIETGALSAVVSVLSAVLAVRAGGDGAWIDVSLWDAAVHSNRFAMAWALSGEPGPVFASQQGPLNGPYRCADGEIVWFAAIEVKFWRRFCAAADRPDLLDHWAGQGAVGFGSEELRAELRTLFAQRSGPEWEQIFKAADIPGNLVLDAHGVVAHPHFSARGLADPAPAKLPTVGAAPVWLESGHRVGHGLTPAPSLGADTDQIVRDWTGRGTMTTQTSASTAEMALQDQHTPDNRCFGCGPASEFGLQIKSRIEDGVVVADWQPHVKYETTGGILSGGIISSLLECHASWGIAVALMARDGLDTAPTSLVTKEITVRFRRAVRIVAGSPVRLTAKVLEERGREWEGEAELSWDGQVCARARLTSVDLNA